MIIDAHTHMMHKKSLETFRNMTGDWAKKKVNTLSEFIQQMPAMVDVQMRLEFLERAQIDLQIVTPLHFMYTDDMPDPVETKCEVARAINDGMIKLMDESKGKLIAVGTVPLEDYEKYGKKEMERAVKGGMKGVAITTHWYGKAIDSPEYRSFWAHVSELDLPVVLHPSDPLASTGRPYESDFDLTHNFGWPFETMLALSHLVFSGTLEAFPDLKIVSHHLGGGIPFLWGRIEETYAPEKQAKLLGRKLTRSLYDLFSLIFYDTAVGGNASAIQCAYDIFGADRLVFATDAPFGPGAGEGRLTSYPKIVRSLGLAEEENQKIFSGNIAKVFNL